MNLLDSIKPQLDAMHKMCEAAFEEGRRSAFREMLPMIEKLQALSGKPNFLTKNEGADTLQKTAGDKNNGTQSGQT